MSEIKFKVDNNENLESKKEIENKKSDAKTWLGIGVAIGFVGLGMINPVIATEFANFAQTIGAYSKVLSHLTQKEEIGDFADVVTGGSLMGNGANSMANKFR